jgi:hypothetical protein
MTKIPNTARTYDDDGKLHSFDGYASVVDNDIAAWHSHGKLHRDNDLPAVIVNFKCKRWYQYDKLHREGGQPAVLTFNGGAQWWEHGKLLCSMHPNEFAKWLSLSKSDQAEMLSIKSAPTGTRKQQFSGISNSL